MKEIIRYRYLILFGIILPLIVGGGFYYIFCPDVIAVQALDAILHLNEGPHVEAINKNSFFIFFRCYMLDALWAFSMENCIYVILADENKGLLKSSVISFAGMLIIEMMQGMHIIKGTFDYLDIMIEAIAIFIALFIIYKSYLGGVRNEEKC